MLKDTLWAFAPPVGERRAWSRSGTGQVIGQAYRLFEVEGERHDLELIAAWGREARGPSMLAVGSPVLRSRQLRGLEVNALSDPALRSRPRPRPTPTPTPPPA